MKQDHRIRMNWVKCFTEGSSIKTSIALESEVNRHTYVSIKAQPFPECVCYLGSVNHCFVICKWRTRPTLGNCPEITDFMCIHTHMYVYILEKEMATHSSILAWKIPWMEEPDGYLQLIGSQRVRHNWATTLNRFYAYSIYCIGGLR